ncbi:hypothetical protein ACFFRR_003687 [Megaselia abdita]
MAGVLFIVTILTKEEESQIEGPAPIQKEPPSTPVLRVNGIDISSFDSPEPSNKIVTLSVENEKGSWSGLKKKVLAPLTQNPKPKDYNSNLGIPEDSCMEVVMKEIFKKMHIDNASWTKANDGKSWQIIFSLESNEKYESMLGKFEDWGIGDREGSSVSVVNCNAFRSHNITKEEEVFSEEKQSNWNKFMNSVAARLNVAQIVRSVRQEATITFDFLVLDVSAAILAAFGLVENSTIFLASSMLISPLMGPIISAIFGTVIKDRKLQVLGVMNECIGLLIATFTGFFFGVIVCSIDEKYGIGEGLTEEMLSRCELHSLYVGIVTALFSGAAAAIGILGGNTGSLVGVAISASLLPPAVNSGLLWALASIYVFHSKDSDHFNSVTKTTRYSEHQATELCILGTISMCLTILNIICIYVMGIIVLKVKEIAPVISNNNRNFWKHDIKIARDFNKNGFDKDAAIIDEFAALPKEDQQALGLNYDFFRAVDLEESQYQNTWSPHGNRMLDSSIMNRQNYKTVTQAMDQFGQRLAFLI